MRSSKASDKRDVRNQLEDHLINANYWEKLETPVPGVFVVKAPATRRKPSMLYLEFNPINEEGNPIKKKGLFIGTKKILTQFREILLHEKVDLIIQLLQEVNPKRKQNGAKQLRM